MDDLIPEFLAETSESLSELDLDLVELEQNPDNQDLLSKIFRVIHTVKGTSGFLDLQRLGSVAHNAEDLLGLFRDGKLSPTPEYISLIFEAIDVIKLVIEGIEETGKEPDGDDSDLIGRLAAAYAGGQGGEAPADAQGVVDELEAAFQSEEVAVPEEVVSEEVVPTAAPVAESTKAVADAPVAKEASTSLQTLRVNVDALEHLMTLVSELVLTRNQILQISRSQQESDIEGSLQRLNHIVSDLQEGVMKTRMQPVGNAWSKLPRIIRDISNDLGKKIDLRMFGQETELDRQVLEMIKDPLTHMVRNSADHGIENPDERIAAGKPETGVIKLDSFQEGGYIIIQISDDGKGLALDKIKSKILENNLVNEAELESMSSQQIQQYIFSAGFSTAEQVTAVSGRGVGMDVVRTNIEKIGGAIEMNSVEGKGTTFTIKIPLTLAIVSSLIVGVEGERFAIPQLDVAELVMVAPGENSKIEMVNDAPVFRLRERILPLVCLRNLLGFTPKENPESEPRYIAVIDAGSSSFGVIVDVVFDTEEIVVKPLSSLTSNQPVFSGNTILGDGHVIMILDSSGILKSSGVADNLAMNREETEEGEEIERANSKSLLLFLAGDENLKAVPLEHVARLEEVDLSKIEMAGGQRVIQYGDTLMPIHLYDSKMKLPDKGNYPVIVFKAKEGMSGLLVDQILDITSHNGEYQIRSDGALEGSAIVQGKTTDIINISYDRSFKESGDSGGGEHSENSEEVSPLHDEIQPVDYGV